MTPQEVERFKMQAIASLDQTIRAMEDETPEFAPACALMRDVLETYISKGGPIRVASMIGRSNAMDAFAAGVMIGMSLVRVEMTSEVRDYLTRRLLDAVTGVPIGETDDAT